MKRIVICLVIMSVMACICVPAYAHSAIETIKSSAVMELSSKSACLMEAETGEILFEQNATEHLEPASVTKIMSVILIYEALQDGRITKSDMVTASSTAAEMGGSQIWLEPSEQMSVDDMLKAILVVSANDCTVAMAEHIAGSEENFVAMMNKKASKLGMNDTNFMNSTGLPCDNHYTCAKDIAIMTRELLKHNDVTSYTTIWMDSLRGGEFGLSNTNKLIRFYPGATGMKTGFTDSAGYCMSATATREGVTFISAVMKADTSDNRFSDSKKLLDYGFANFSVYKIQNKQLSNISVKNSAKSEIPLKHEGDGAILLPKGREKMVEEITSIPEYLEAPIRAGDKIGSISYILQGEEIARHDIVACEDAEKINYIEIFKKLMLCCGIRI